MSHITQAQAVELALDAGMATEGVVGAKAQELCNAAIEWYIAQQAASGDATFKKWNDTTHKSDCAVYNEPAYPNGPCDCGAAQTVPKVSWNLKYADSTPRLSVGHSAFEDWFQKQPFATQVGIKQMCRDSYAAGMGDPLVTYAPTHIGNVDSACTSQERVCETAKSEQVPLTDEQIDKCVEKVWGSYAEFDEVRLFTRLIESAHGIGGEK